LGDIRELGILIGYHSTGGYKIFDTTNRRIMISRDVIFDEIKELQYSATDCYDMSTSYTNKKCFHEVLEGTKPSPIENQMKENVRRSSKQKSFEFCEKENYIQKTCCKKDFYNFIFYVV
jgi:hypothetical protein